MTRIIKQLFCKHEYRWCTRSELFFNLSGETRYLVCKKCGKIKDSMFIKYD